LGKEKTTNVRLLCHSDDVVCRVRKLFEWTIQGFLKVAWNLFDWALEDFMPILKQQQPVDAVEDLGRWLMDRADNSQIIIITFSLQHFDDSERSRAIEPTCRLVTKEKHRIRDELVTNTDPLSLSTRKSFP
jgi:hypothetical protein